MLFSEINPFLRFVRLQSDTNRKRRPVCRPYDARFFYALDGNGKILANGEEYEMKKGSALIINAAVEYHLKTPSNFVTYCVVNFDYTQKYSHIKTPVSPQKSSLFDDSGTIGKVEFSDMTQFNSVVYFDDLSHLEGKLLRCEREFSKQLLFYDRKISGIFSEILIDCARRINMGERAKTNEKIENILSYLHANFHRTITNEEMSEMFSYHPNYLSNMIKSYTGLSLHKYIMQLRLLNAVKLLESGEKTIGEIAEKCGFCDIYHFSKCFKKEMGVSPAQYRKSN